MGNRGHAPISRAIALAGLLLISISGSSQTSSSPVPIGFPLNLWLEHKQVTQIPWVASVSKVRLRSDFRQELSIWVGANPIDSGSHDFIFFARAIKGDKAITEIHSETPSLRPAMPVPFSPGVYWMAIVRPGKYKLELAMFDRATGRYSTRYEDFSVTGDENDPLEQSFRSYPEFEFAEKAKVEDRELPSIDSMISVMVNRTIGNSRNPGQMPPNLSTGDGYVSTGPPSSFVIDKPGTLHLSVITIVSPPEVALGEPYYLSLFHGNLKSLLSVFRRIHVVRGSAKLTAVDLANRTLVLDRRDMEDVTPDMIKSAIDADVNTVSIDALKGSADSARFFQDVLRSHVEAAQKEAAGAEHVIIVVAARSDFPKGSVVLPPSSAQDCRCRVIYMRFALRPTETDDLDNLLKPYKPRVFEPLDLPQFRKDFGTIYQQLVR